MQYSTNGTSWTNASNPQTLNLSSSCTVYARYKSNSNNDTAGNKTYNFTYQPTVKVSNFSSTSLQNELVGKSNGSPFGYWNQSYTLSLPAGYKINVRGPVRNYYSGGETYYTTKYNVYINDVWYHGGRDDKGDGSTAQPSQGPIITNTSSSTQTYVIKDWINYTDFSTTIYVFDPSGNLCMFVN